MPAAFQAPPKIVMSGAALRATSAILLCFLGLLASLGESPLFWMVLGGAVIVVAAITGGGSGGGEGGSPVAHFGFPAEFRLVNEEEGELVGIGERPQVRTLHVNFCLCELFGVCVVNYELTWYVFLLPRFDATLPQVQDKTKEKEHKQ